jgi:hypothetical protein
VARKSLKPQLNQIRTWVRQGRTDAWIAHQLAVSVKDITEFKREQDLVSDESEPANANENHEEVDLRAEDDALVAAELEAEPTQGETAEAQQEPDSASESDEQLQKRRRRRGRRGGRGRRTTRNDRTSLEATFDHGEEGYGLWLDPAVADDPVYIDHWAGHRSVSVTVEPDRIVIQRAGQQPEPPSQDEDTENNMADSD